MNKHSLQLLEFDKVLQLLSQMAATPAAKNAALSIPFLSQQECERNFTRVSSLLKVIKEAGRPPFSSIESISPLLKMIQPENSFLSCRETRQCAEWLQFSEEVRRFFKNFAAENDITPIDPLIDQIGTWPEIKNIILRAINDQGEMNDNASPELKKIRKTINQTSEMINASLKKILNSSKSESWFQEKIITIRNDRFVIPLKANHSGKIKGIIQDRSASGETFFLEPASVVGLNNQLKQLLFDEEKEITEVLKKIATQLRETAEEMIQTEQTLTAIDLLSAQAALANKWQCSRPTFSENIYLKNARHPLLHTEPVPVDIIINKKDNMLVITGPNTGGKTVSLKTIGLLSLMARCGLFIPADSESSLRYFEKIFCDIGDEQSIEQNLSTFSAHIKNINHIIKKCDATSLVLLDELGAGTDPLEGSALGIAIMDTLLEKNSTAVITTHYSAIKDHAFTAEKVSTAGVEFDLKSLQPTYKLLFGMPGSSRALDIAHRLGMPAYIIKKARTISENALSPEVKIIGKIEKELAGAQEKKKLAEAQLRIKEKLSAEYEKRLKKIEQEKEKIIATARKEIKQKFQRAETTIKDLIKTLRSSKHQVTAKEESKIKSTLRETLHTSLESLSPQPKEIELPTPLVEKNDLPLQEGDIVLVTSLGKEGSIITCDHNKKSATVAIGSMHIKATFKEIEKKGSPRKEKKQRSIPFVASKSVYPSLDIRGARYEEACDQIRHYLDDAALAGLSQVTIIHGKGGGSLRKATEETVRHHPAVKKAKFAMPEAGGYGATEVLLK